MAVVKVPGFTRFDRWGANLGRLSVTDAVHVEALDGTDELKITCDDDLNKGDRVVWVDRRGTCHEHIVDEPTRTHDGDGEPATSATCINSIAELWDDYVVDKVPSGGVAVALRAVLENTRWQVGNCDQMGSASHKFYHVSAREALADLLSVWGGELETEVTSDGSGVTGRAVRIRAMRGDQGSAKRFTWTKDLISISRTVASDNPKTRVYGYGKGVETDGGGYGRRLTFADVNGGREYVEDAEATAVWGRPDGRGGVAPAVGVYVNEQCDDAATLLAETSAFLDSAKEPKVTYVSDVEDLAAFGRDWEDVGLGDSVAIVDRGFTEAGIRLRGRVSQIERDLLSNDATVTFGNVFDAMADMWQGVSQALKGGSQRSALYDAVAGASPGWLERLQGSLNEQFDKAGSYRVETFEIGTVWSNVPLDAETGRPKKRTSSMWAININGRGFRIADGLASDGSWDWRTFGTGEGFTADAINAGTLNADLVRAGTLADAKGRNFWDMETGEFALASSATVGGKTVAAIAQDAADDLDVALTQREIFNRLTNDGKTQGIYLSGGLLYVNATYLKTGIISDAYGRNSWNLGNGTLTTKYMTAQSATVDGTITTGASASCQAKMTDGAVRFYYNSRETIELVSIPSYTDGSKGGYLQCCNGATYLGLRAPKLYTALNTSEAGTIGSTGSIWVVGFDSRPGDGWDIADSKVYQLGFKNGICISGNVN